MITRRDFLQVAAAAAAVTGLGGRLRPCRRAAGDPARTQLLQFAPKGQLTILHMADCHAQLKPLYYREPSLNLGVGEASGQAAAHHRRRAAQRLRHPGALAARLHAELGRLRGAGQDLRPRRRHGPHRDPGQGDPGRARPRARAAARRRRCAAGLLHGAQDQGRRHGRRAARAGRRRPPRGIGSSRWARERVAELFGGVGGPGSSGSPFLAGNVRDTDFEEPVFHARACSSRAASASP